MSRSSDDRSSPALEPVLRDVEAELRRHLRDACEAEATGVSTESTSEIRRLEDSLLAAAVAAEQTIALRRHLERGKSPVPNESVQSENVPNEPADPVLRVREFRDTAGQLWRAWPVMPGQARPGRTAERYLGEFHKGWICFEALDSTARRRLPGQRTDWTELEDPELCQLLDQAINAPQRKRREEARAEPGTPLH